MNNQLIIDERETGKTTYLLSEADRLLNDGCSIIIMDSATDHEDKSLLRKVMAKYEDTKLYDIRESSVVTIQNGINEFIAKINSQFPFSSLIKKRPKIICFDLSYFLEKGHDVFDETGDFNQYTYYRNLYNNLAQQIIVSLIMLDYYGIISNTVVLMDEIEFPVVDFDISSYQRNISFTGAVHSENGFGTFYKSFEKAKFKAYKRKGQ